MSRASSSLALPEPFTVLADLALDLRWTWSYTGDELWRAIFPDSWDRIRNPWTLLQDVPRSRWEALASDSGLLEELARISGEREAERNRPAWFPRTHGLAALAGVAFFSMEFGLGEALPLYAGGLGVLAGDFLKTASDMGLPATGVGILWQVGYFRQFIDADGAQRETYPYNEPASLPLQPVRAPRGERLSVALELPGRHLRLRVWRAQVGRVPLYLLDSNDPRNSPLDRGITSELYGGGTEMRLLQELVLGIGGWRLLEMLGRPAEICHLNEGHAAFVVLERARRFAESHTDISFQEALWATRVGNVFTTHTPVPAGFDVFGHDLIERYFPPGSPYIEMVGGTERFLALGRRDPNDRTEPFTTAHLALRGSSWANGVSRLHGAVSRELFRGLFPRWPECEVPVGHVTNGVHVPSWDSRWADAFWTEACGKARWLDTPEGLPPAIASASDTSLWRLRNDERRDLVRYVRERLALQLHRRGASDGEIAEAGRVLDPDALTVGFARRFATYKRPDLLLHDRQRLARLLRSEERPVQIIVAGKAHPNDEEGKRLVREWIAFVQQPITRRSAVFLEDYDLALAQELVQGVDVWINTPRRPFEACGTSGMKVLVNGGLNLSELDGWWAEAATSAVGWSLGDGREHGDPGWDAAEAGTLYEILEREVVPSFYERDPKGVPQAWLARVRASMADLAPRFSANRMLREYVETVYLDAAAALRKRQGDGARLARELAAWSEELRRGWSDVRFEAISVAREGGGWRIEAVVKLGVIAPDSVRVELYADPRAGEEPVRAPMERVGPAVEASGAWLYRGTAPGGRDSGDFTPRVLAHHPDARIPCELALVRWPDEHPADRSV